MQFVILIGACGSGKTTIARAIAQRHAADIDVLHFDGIGVPSVEQMIAEHGSGEQWQRARTIEWMASWTATMKPAPGVSCSKGSNLNWRMKP